MHVLDRHNRHPARLAYRRLFLVILAIMALGVLWHALHPNLVRRAAGLSIGWPMRQRLLIAALAHRLPSIPTRTRAITKPVLWTGTFKTDDYVYWTQDVERSSPQSEVEGGEDATARALPYYGRSRTCFVDGSLRNRGRVRGGGPLISRTPPGDMDADGSWEIVMGFTIAPATPATQPGPRSLPVPRPRNRFAVLRLGARDNELVWAGLAYDSLPDDPESQIVPLRRDEDGDGLDELLFVTKRRRPWPQQGYEPPRTLAVFAWDRPGGVLHARAVQPDGGVVFWTPPEILPVPLRLNEEIRGAIDLLLVDLERLLFQSPLRW